MDIALLGKRTIRLKGKTASFVIDPASDISKVDADGIILLKKDNYDVSSVSDSRILINGSGEYEVGGVKISGIKIPDEGAVYKFLIDSVSVVVGRVDKYKGDGLTGCQIAVLSPDGDFNESSVTSLDPKIIALYGDNSQNAAKKLGAENVNSVSKLTVAKDKLPEKMEVSVLG
jgi:hypothetical protein